MNLLDEFKNLKEYCAKNRKPLQVKDIDLNKKVDDYLNWYDANMIKGRINETNADRDIADIRDLIEKIAVWYETIYPNYVINDMMYCCGTEMNDTNEIMIDNNPYIMENFDDDSDVHLLEWSKFMNIHSLIKTMPYQERYVLDKYHFPSIIYLVPSKKNIYDRAHIHVNKDGIVDDAEYIYSLTTLTVKDEDLIGLHVKDVAKLFMEKCVILPEGNEFIRCLDAYDRYLETREGILDAIMYRIIERGGNRIGPRRAFIFAKDFERNIDIPMMYGLDHSDPGLRLFINDYIKAGGNPDLVGYTNYFNAKSDDEKIKTVSLRELFATIDYTCTKFYTPEEEELLTRLVTALKPASEEVEKEQIKQKRIERKLAKSQKKNSNN